MAKSKRRTKPGPKGRRAEAKLPRYASFKTKLQLARNQQRSGDSVNQLIYGYRLLWKHCPELMKRFGFGKAGSFDKCNGFGGVCWGWRKECSMTKSKAEQLAFAAWQSKALTHHQMCVIRKALCFSHELRGGGPRKNWGTVDRVYDLVRKTDLAKAHFTVVPTKIPTVSDLKKAFDTEWTVDNVWSFMVWLGGLVCAYDTFLERAEER